MRRAAIAALAACGGAAPPPALPSNQHGAAVRADRTCKRSHEALRRLFITSAGDQLDGVKDQLALDAEPTDTPPAQPGYDDPSAIDPQHLIHVDRPESFEDVLYVDLQVGFDGLYATGVAGIFVGCRYAAISHTAATPIDDEVLRPDALVALGWLTADRAAKQRIARDFVVAVLLNIAYPVSDGKDDFGATFVGDDGKPVTRRRSRRRPPPWPPTGRRSSWHGCRSRETWGRSRTIRTGTGWRATRSGRPARSR